MRRDRVCATIASDAFWSAWAWAAATAVLGFVFLVERMLVFFLGTFTTDLDTAKLVPGITVGGQALGRA